LPPPVSEEPPPPPLSSLRPGSTLVTAAPIPAAVSFTDSYARLITPGRFAGFRLAAFFGAGLGAGFGAGLRAAARFGAAERFGAAGRLEPPRDAAFLLPPLRAFEAAELLLPFEPFEPPFFAPPEGLRLLLLFDDDLEAGFFALEDFAEDLPEDFFDDDFFEPIPFSPFRTCRAEVRGNRVARPAI